MRRYGHIILGTGQATGTLLQRLIPTGDSIAVVEGHRVGGSCVNYGCTPTKALVASARAIHVARRGSEFGFDASPVTIDFGRVRARMNAIRGGSTTDLTKWMESTPNVTLVRGWGRFVDAHTLRVGDEMLHGRRIYINTGTRASTPGIAGIDAVRWLDTERLLDVDVLPEHLVVVGGGYVGLELAQVFRRFGSRVTVLQREAQPMPREDADVSEALRGILEGEGVRIVCEAAVEAATTGDAGVEVSVRRSSGVEEVIAGSHLLLAVGRTPNSDRLALDTTSIEIDRRGYIVVDDVCQTAEEDVFAVGDVNGHGAFTHTSVNDAEIVLDHLFGGDRRLSQRIPIYALFTDPPLGRIGMTERDALATGKRVLTATRPMSRIMRAKEMSETAGFAKLIVDADTDLLLGAAILGPGGDEIVNMFAPMMRAKIPCKRFRESVLVHPTVGELMPWILDDLASP